MPLNYLSKILITNIYKKIRIFSKKNNLFRTLMYHSIYDDKVEITQNNIWKLSLTLFKEQINFLNKNKKFYKSENLIYEAPKNGVSITFDDGNDDCYHLVAPFLFDLKIPFSIFIITNFLKEEKRGYMNEGMLKELSKNPLVSIGSHTKNHYRLTNYDSSTVSNELSESKSYLEDILGKKINMLSYPHGKYNNLIKKIAMETGYTLAFSSNFSVNTINQNKFALSRNEIWKSDKIHIFKQKLNGDWDWLKYRKL